MDPGQIDATLATSFGRLHCWELSRLGVLAAVPPQALLAADEVRRHGAPAVAGLLRPRPRSRP